MIDFSPLEVWFIVGSQHLYGPETLRQVEADSRQIVEALNAEAGLPIRLVLKPVVKTPDEITAIVLEAEAAPNLHRSRRMDAHLQPVKDVDRRSDRG